MLDTIKTKIMMRMLTNVGDIYELGQDKMDIHDMLNCMMRIGLLSTDEYCNLDSYLDDCYDSMKALSKTLS